MNKPETIDDYIAAQEEARQYLNAVRETIRGAIPEAEERISWGMPTYWKAHNIIHFGAARKHVGIYPGAEAIEHFGEELKAYSTSKGTIRIPYGDETALELIAEIARWCMAQERGEAEDGADAGESGRTLEYDAVIRAADRGGAYVVFPWDIREEFGRGRLKVHAEFDGEPYDGSIVNMGVKNTDGSVCYIIGITKAVRRKIGREPGDSVHVKITAV